MIWKHAFLVLLAISSTAQEQPAVTASENQQLKVIRAGTLIDGTSAQPFRNRVIVVRGNRIEKVLPEQAAEAIPGGPGVEIIDLSRAIVLPGLIDCHTHMFLQGEDPKQGGYDIQLLNYSLAYRAARATVSARRALEQGFTTIRDLELEGAGYGDLGIKRAVEEGHIPGPRIFGVGRAISTTGGYPLEGYAPEIEDTLPKGVQMLNGPVEGRKVAREQLNNGVDWIKVYMTHRSWVDKQGNLVSQPTLTVDELKAIVDETHGWITSVSGVPVKRKVACHAYSGVGLQRALDGGCDSIEHGLELTDANVAQMVKQGTWYVPTLSVYYSHQAAEDTAEGKRDRKRTDVHGPSFQKALKAGVKIAFGTDVGGFPWTDSIAQEFKYMVDLGMSPMDAIKAATSRAAELLEMQGQLGVIAPGAFADIVAVSGDPLQNVDELKSIKFVMKDGKVFKSELH